MNFTRFRSLLALGLILGGLATAAVAQTPAAVAAGDWPQFRGPNRDGKSAEKGLLAQWPEGGPKLLWSATGIGIGFSHVSVAGTVYVTGLVGTEGVLRAYTLDGKLAWEAKYGPEYAKDHPGARTIPTVCDGLVYVMSGLGTLSCLDAASGKPVWSAKVFELADAKEIMWGYAESVLIDGDKVFVTPNGKKAAMMAFDRKTGKNVWASAPLDLGTGFVSPLMVEFAKKRMIVSASAKAVTAWAPEDGKVIWQYQNPIQRGNPSDMPIFSDGMLYVTSGYAKGAEGLELAADGTGVKQAWAQLKQDPVHGQAVLVDGYVYASSHQSITGKWSCVEFKTGKLMWQDGGVGKGGSVIYADGMLYCYSEDGNVGLVRPSPEKCQVVSTFKVTQGDGDHWAHLVVSHGRLFVRHGNALMCYGISAG